ncbi:MAG: hypothetical protein KF780_06500 [Sphingomonas sp.]|nr:hypothetical protein [Sphingomonas sp.]
MRRFAFALAAAAIAVLPAAPALAGSSASENAGNDRSDAGNRMICRRIERSGSRMSTQRICRTARQWEAARNGQSIDQELDETVGQQMDVVSRDMNTGCLGGMTERAGPR